MCHTPIHIKNSTLSLSGQSVATNSLFSFEPIPRVSASYIPCLSFRQPTHTLAKLVLTDPFKKEHLYSYITLRVFFSAGGKLRFDSL